MTVVNAMIFNANEGGLVTDSQVTSGVRKRNIGEKVLALDTPWNMQVIVGGTGYLAEIAETYFGVRKAYESIKKDSRKKSFDKEDADLFTQVDQFAYLLSRVTVAHARNAINHLLKSTYNLSEEELRSKEDISTPLYEKALELYEGRGMKGDRFDTEFLILGKDADGLRMYTVDFMQPPCFVGLAFENIGSGHDKSDDEMSRYFEDLRRVNHKNVSLVEGIEELLRATNLSSRSNEGVGGIPSVHYIAGTKKNSKVCSLGEEESLLASEIVKVRDRSLISQKTCRDGLEELIYGRAPVDNVKKKVFKKNYHKINEFLRGYKI